MDASVMADEGVVLAQEIYLRCTKPVDGCAEDP